MYSKLIYIKPCSKFLLTSTKNLQHVDKKKKKNGLSPDEMKAQFLDNHSAPRNADEMQVLLGYVKNFSTVTFPLTALWKKDVP